MANRPPASGRRNSPSKPSRRGADPPDRTASAVEEFLREFPDRAEQARSMFQAVKERRGDRFLIRTSDSGISVIGWGGPELIQRIEREAADLRNALAVVERWRSDELVILDLEAGDNGLDVWHVEAPKPTRQELLQAFAVLDALSAKLFRHAELLRAEWAVPRHGGRPGNDALLLETFVALLLKDKLKRIQRLWVERLAPELIGRELSRERQRRRESARRSSKTKSKAQHRQT